VRKEEFWHGGCKVERKWEKNGNYKEEVKCKGGVVGGALQRRSTRSRRLRERHVRDKTS
jgi:hypothetical protein